MPTSLKIRSHIELQPEISSLYFLAVTQPFRGLKINLAIPKHCCLHVYPVFIWAMNTISVSTAKFPRRWHSYTSYKRADCNKKGSFLMRLLKGNGKGCILKRWVIAFQHYQWEGNAFRLLLVSVVPQIAAMTLWGGSPTAELTGHWVCFIPQKRSFSHQRKITARPKSARWR